MGSPVKPWALCWTLTLSQRGSEPTPLLAVSGTKQSGPTNGKISLFKLFGWGVDLVLIPKTARSTGAGLIFLATVAPTPTPTPNWSCTLWLKAVEMLGSFTRGLALNPRRRWREIRTDPAGRSAQYQELAPAPGAQLQPLGNRHFHFLSPLSSPAAGRRAESRNSPLRAPIGRCRSPCQSAPSPWCLIGPAVVHTLRAAPPPGISSLGGLWNAQTPRTAGIGP